MNNSITVENLHFTKITCFTFKSCQRNPLLQHHLQFCLSTWGVMFSWECLMEWASSLDPNWTLQLSHLLPHGSEIVDRLHSAQTTNGPGSKTSVTVWTAVTQGWLKGNPWYKSQSGIWRAARKETFPPGVPLLFSAQTYFSKGVSLEFTSARMSVSKHVNCM